MRLIDADDLMKKYELIHWYSVSKSGGLMRGATSEDNPVIHYYDGEEVIKNAPTIEAEPVRHCVWVCGDYYDVGDVCSECDLDSLISPCDYRYCPNCGCKMDKEE